MKFWDSSGVVPLLFEQDATAEVDGLRSEDPEMVAWWGTPTECVSAIVRLRREERLTLTEEERVLHLLERLRESWMEILPSEEVRNEAARLLRLHPLRAEDALQLGAARIWAGAASRAEIVTFDERLGLAARLEGFTVLPRT